MQRKIVLQPNGLVALIDEGETILQAAQKVGFNIEASCGGQKVCGKCRIQIMEGFIEQYGIHSSIQNVSGITDVEKKFFSSKEIENQYRLACLTHVQSDVVIEIPSESRRSDGVILEAASGKSVELNPAVKTYFVELNRPTLFDHKDDSSRLKDALIAQYSELDDALEIDFGVLKQIPTVLRSGDFSVTVSILYDRRIIKVVEGKKKNNYGVAIDVGTTTIVTYLCNLEDGQLKQSASMMNPQIRYGDDVLTRISYCINQKNGIDELQELLIDGLNELIQEMVEKEEIEILDVVEAVIVFNTVMEHIALGITPEYLGKSPFSLVVSDALDIPAEKFGLKILPSGNVHCLPAEAGFIGADHVAVLITEEPYLQEKIKLIIDIGTNSEICLGNKDKLVVTSCATGPAFEGAQIKCGMRAAKGAIEAIEINPITLESNLRIIGGVTTPIGICGSGVLDAIAQMSQAGIIEPDGKFSKKLSSKWFRIGEDGKKEYVLYFKRDESESDIVVTQKDVRAVQLAKAALYAGAKALMNHTGIEKIDEIILAGAFGSYIDKKNALLLGLFPDCHLDQVSVVGNAAGLGARFALLNKDKRKEAIAVARMTEFVETATRSDYQKNFSEAMAIPHSNHSFHINQNPTWFCSGTDQRVMSLETIDLGLKAFEEINRMDKAILSNQRAENKDFLTFPLIQNIEAVAYGGQPKLILNNYVISEYPFKSIEEINLNQSIVEHPMIQTMLECISRHTYEQMVLEVQGPFSILSTLINPTTLFTLRRKNKKALMDALNQIVDSLATYTIECIQRGVNIISFADPEGVAELVGIKIYKELSGLVAIAYLKKIEAYLDRTVVHLCGKTSYSLQKVGYITTKTYRVEENKTYMEILFEVAKEKKFKFIGHSCIHTKQLSVPIIQKLELVNE